MAQIITLKEILDRMRHLSRSQFETSRGNEVICGPAQLLFFTGVRYERYENVGPETSKLVKRPSRKKSLPHLAS